MQNDDSTESSLSLKEMIRRVQTELMESQLEREASGLPALFAVDGLTLEVNFVVTKSKGASGGFDFKVLTFGGIKAGGDLEHQEQQTHKIILSLKGNPDWKPELLDICLPCS
ncbi:MAG: trypco2 family protein [Acidobacteriota bacterium]